jgi:hypothetical protein
MPLSTSESLERLVAFFRRWRLAESSTDIESRGHLA